MTDYECYIMYLAVKRHFTSDYDYGKYNGKVNVYKSSFDKRKDKYQFLKLAKQSDPIGLVVANLFDNPTMWVGDLFDDNASRTYTAMKKRRETLTYTFKQELLSIDDLKEALKVTAGNHPPLLKLYLRGKICPETMLILDDIGQIFDFWDSKIVDEYQWPDVKKRLENYRTFFSYDKKRYRQIFKDVMEEQLEAV